VYQVLARRVQTHLKANIVMVILAELTQTAHQTLVSKPSATPVTTLTQMLFVTDSCANLTQAAPQLHACKENVQVAITKLLAKNVMLRVVLLIMSALVDLALMPNALNVIMLEVASIATYNHAH